MKILPNIVSKKILPFAVTTAMGLGALSCASAQDKMNIQTRQTELKTDKFEPKGSKGVGSKFGLLGVLGLFFAAVYVGQTGLLPMDGVDKIFDEWNKKQKK